MPEPGGQPLRYSVLDLFRSPLESAELAQRADALRFHRYWVGEHHTPTLCPNPLLLGAVLLGLTEHVRIGTGALGILARSPLSIAEDIRVIRMLFGDRFDLGITRGFVGTGGDDERATAEIRGLLLDGRDEARLREQHGERMGRLCSWLRGDAAEPPVMWVVGSSAEAARSAAALGVGFCTSLYHARSIADLDAALAVYRDGFQPVAGLAEPYAILVQSGVCAASSRDAEAAIRSFFLGDKSDAVELTDKPMGPWLYAGTGERCREAIEAVIARFRPDELMIHNLVPQSLEMEIQSLELIAAALRLGDEPSAVAPGAIPDPDP